MIRLCLLMLKIQELLAQDMNLLQNMFRLGKGPTASRQAQEAFRLVRSRSVDSQTRVGRITTVETMIASEITPANIDTAGGGEHVAFVPAFVSQPLSARTVTSR